VQSNAESNMSEVAYLLGGEGVKVMTTQGRGSTPEEIADRAVDRIISVGSQTHPVIRDQAEAFKDNIRKILVFYINEAVQSDRVTLANRLKRAGHPELVKLLRD
jgi:hypothetical protein